MISKIIHYCWFGKSELPNEIKLCIESWRKFCPDYYIKCWNETNSPVHVRWVKEAYKHQKWAFVADYVRFYALYNDGGVYMDTDMLLKKGLDMFINEEYYLGLQDKLSVNMAIAGSIKKHTFNKK